MHLNPWVVPINGLHLNRDLNSICSVLTEMMTPTLYHRALQFDYNLARNDGGDF